MKKSTSLEITDIFSFSEERVKEKEFKTWLSIATERLLDEKNWTQKELAKASRITEATITKILQGNQNVTLQTLAKLSVALDEDLFCTKESVSQVREIQRPLINLAYPKPQSDRELEPTSNPRTKSVTTIYSEKSDDNQYALAS